MRSFAAFLFILGLLSLPSSALNLDQIKRSIWDKIGCDACIAGLVLIDGLLKANVSYQVIFEEVVKFCVSANIEDYNVCHGLIVNTYGPEVLQLLLQTALNPKTICLGAKFCNQSAAEAADPEATLAKAAARQRQAKINTPIPPRTRPPRPRQPRSSSNSSVGYVLHLTDVHLDMQYTVNATVDCGEPLCCRNLSANGTRRAPYWGDYECDINVWLFSSMLTFIAEKLTPKPDFWIWTGDNPPHDVWEESPQGQLNVTGFLCNLIKRTFPGTTVYPALGNHESYPCDQFHLPEHQWLADAMTEYWSGWLDADALATVKKGIYYTTLVAPGHRIMALNTQAGDPINFYWILGSTDIANQTEWIVQTLQAAEEAGEKVWLIGHIPSSALHDNLDSWAEWFNAVLVRYSDTIAAQFFGHTHHDQFVTITDSNGTPVGVQFIAPSVTTYTYQNPSFRVYTYDKETLEILDYDMYFLNLTDTLLTGIPRWGKSYSALSYFNMKDLSPASYQNLYEQLRTDPNTWKLYYNAYKAWAVPASHCTGYCRHQTICETQGATTDRFYKCMGSFSSY